MKPRCIGPSVNGSPGAEETRVAQVRRRTIKVIVGLAVLVIDVLIVLWVVPVAEERVHTDYGSGGYLVAFAMAFWTVMAFAILVAAPRSEMSYPSEHLK